MYINMFVYSICIYIYRERERERERDVLVCVVEFISAHSDQMFHRTGDVLVNLKYA